MAHYAKIVNGKVTEVIVAEEDVIVTRSGTWVQTSYNTHGGVHRLDGTPLRKNYAGMGYTYDADKDAFIAPKPYASWTLDESTNQWTAPTAYPDDGKMYTWNEDTTNWVEVV